MSRSDYLEALKAGNPSPEVLHACMELIKSDGAALRRLRELWYCTDSAKDANLERNFGDELAYLRHVYRLSEQYEAEQCGCADEEELQYLTNERANLFRAEGALAFAKTLPEAYRQQAFDFVNKHYDYDRHEPKGA